MQNQNQQADRFTLTDAESGTVHIVFLPQILRQNRKVPQLDYQGAEGKFTFRGNEVKQQQSNLGLLISVTLKTNAEADLDLALVLPSINLVGQKRQDFETVAIATTKSRKVIANQAGIQFNCKVLTLKGYAENLSMVTPDSRPSTGWQNPSWFPHTRRHEDLYNLMDFHRF
ncbi:hypothetical protein [Synechocystis sp. PCC 7509]|uniref:hypothetical protein n=1 Tax=Synechocystis sp. PCC 7509 TaxID=927677 RepID=UPI0002AC1EC0|nr:hypothetical protein [Synechocystis sp. PCC 7509]